MATVNYGDGFSFSGISADIGPFYVLGGRYAFALSATWGGSGAVMLQQLMLDGTTYISALAAAIAADGSVIVDLPPGSFKLDVTDATALQGSLIRIPLGRSV